jgi:hypothetical protein
MARKLNADDASPLHQHIVVPAENDFSTSLAGARRAGDWAVSMATVVEGTVRLISSNPKHDAYKMAGEVRYEGHDRSVLDPGSDLERTPLRELYRECNDEMIHTALTNYFSAVEKVLWREANPGTFIRKTVGLQALFDLSRPLLYAGVKERDLRVPRFVDALEPAKHINFSDGFFHASGASRTTIRKTLEYALGWSKPSPEDPNYDEYCRVLR